MTIHTSIEMAASSYYWKPATIAQTDEIHAELLQATADRSGLAYFVAQVFSAPDAIPLGYQFGAGSIDEAGLRTL